MSEEVKDPEVESKEQREPTPEELHQMEENRKQQKKELMAFYKAELPLLELQAKYEEAMTRIDVAKMTRLEIMIAKSQMMSPPKGAQDGPGMPESEEHIKPEKKDRTLKKD